MVNCREPIIFKLKL